MSETLLGRSSDARDGRQETKAAAGTPSSASPPGRKYGLHLINHPQIMMQSDPPDKGPNSGGRHLRRSAVETFLDDNSDFLEDYIQRKVNRRQLEQWLFKSNRMRSGAEQAAGSQFREHAHLKSQHSSLQAPPSPSCRQRSRSFTPLRKLSATKFEESGLATPILNRDVDGQVSFLRTQRNVEQKEYANSDHGRGEQDHSGQQQQCIISLVEDIVREKEEIGIARRLSTGIKKAIHTPVESVKVLLTKKQSAFSGVMYELDNYHVFTKHTSATADTLMTAAMTSKQVSGEMDAIFTLRPTLTPLQA